MSYQSKFTGQEIDAAVQEAKVLIGKSVVYCSTAKVGQVLRVVEVDENGKPTKWEAVDMPSGGSGENVIAPHIGENGNWYLGETDTGVKAQGENGDDYVLTDADKQEIAELAADLVEVPGSGGNVDENPHYSTLTSPYSGKTANFLGDSITALNTVNASKPYHAWVAELLGVSVNNYGLNGSSFADNSSSAKTFCERYESMVDADLVVVAGGVNDTLHGSTLGAMGDTTTATVYGALDVLCQGLRAKYPVADIVFLTPTEWVNSKELSVVEVAEAVVSVCKKYAIAVYDNRTFSGIYPTQSANKKLYLSDIIHWNDTAHEKVGRELSSFLLRLKGYPSYHFVKAVQTEYSVTNKLTNVTNSSNTAVVSAGDSYTATLTANDGYVLSGVTVTMSGADITAAVYANGVISIDGVTGNVVITASATKETEETTYYTVTNNLTNAQTNNAAVSVEEGSAYSATITAVDGYALESVTVTMGGVDVTADVYAGGMVSIGNVSGDMVITAKASAVPDNMVYPYPELKDGYSLGLPTTYAYVLCDVLPVGVIKTLEIRMKTAGTLNCYLATYDAGNKSVTITNQFSVEGTTSFTEHSLNVPIANDNTVLIVHGTLSRTNAETEESGGYEYNYIAVSGDGLMNGSTYNLGRTVNGFDIAFAVRLGIEPA